MERRLMVEDLSRRLDGRKLIWFGTRGDDVESLAELPELSAAFSIIGAYERRNSIDSLSLEQLSGVRVDLDDYDIDAEPDRHAFTEFRSAALRVLSARCAVITYRPSSLVSALCFARRDRCLYLGMFKDHQDAFEHKPWLETSIADLGVAHVPWTYIADEEQLDTVRFIEEGPVMLRRSRTSGGIGVVRVDSTSALDAAWPKEPEAFVSVAPFIDGGMPVNVGAVVWTDGITMHPASVQLIGLASCTSRPYGYCGNDFGAAAQLGPVILDHLEQQMTTIGWWLHANGYRGAFGADFLVKDGVPLFLEVNPRFQGSTHASSQLSSELEESCILMDHLGACLGLSAPPSLRLRDYALAAELSHLVVHWTGPRAAVDGHALASRLLAGPSAQRCDVVVSPMVQTDHGATVARVTVRTRLTSTGFDLDRATAALVEGWRSTELLHLPGASPGTGRAGDSALRGLIAR